MDQSQLAPLHTREHGAINEEMIDWMAKIQIPKIMAAYSSIMKQKRLKYADADIVTEAGYLIKPSDIKKKSDLMSNNINTLINKLQKALKAKGKCIVSKPSHNSILINTIAYAQSIQYLQHTWMQMKSRKIAITLIKR